jgi:GTP-binding protein Era
MLPEAVAILPCSASQGPNDPGIKALRRILTGGPDVAAAIRDLGRPIPGMFRDQRKLVMSDDEAKCLLPISPPLYDQDILTDRTERFIASEMIRAALFQSLKKELPYCCEVQISAFKEPVQGQTPIIRIEASVVVERDSQKIIVIGKNGEKIKQVGIAARHKLEDFFQSKVSILVRLSSVNAPLRDPRSFFSLITPVECLPISGVPGPKSQSEQRLAEERRRSKGVRVPSLIR